MLDGKHGYRSLLSFMPPGDKETFETFNIPSMRFRNRSDRRYLVYKNASEYMEVEANNAQDAIDKSGVIQPFKVVHVVRNLKGVINQVALEKIETGNAGN